MRPIPQRPLGASAQRGVTLIVALVMLLAIGFMSAAIMRGAMTAETVANNLRVQNFAMQQAQLGLRYCESMIIAPQAMRDAAGIIIPSAAPADDASYSWKKFASWHGGAKLAVNVPDSWQSASAQFKPAQAPQCLIERLRTLNVGGYVVTSRGFSADWSEDASGHTTSGSVVWLQSIVAM